MSHLCEPTGTWVSATPCSWMRSALGWTAPRCTTLFPPSAGSRGVGGECGVKCGTKVYWNGNRGLATATLHTIVAILRAGSRGVEEVWSSHRATASAFPTQPNPHLLHCANAASSRAPSLFRCCSLPPRCTARLKISSSWLRGEQIWAGSIDPCPYSS